MTTKNRAQKQEGYVITLSERPSKAFMMISHAGMFKSLASALEEVECQMTENFEEGHDSELIIIDTFFLNAGGADYLKKQKSDSIVLLIIHPREVLDYQCHFLDQIDDVIMMEPYHEHEDLFFIAVDWLKNAWRDSMPGIAAKQFGAGLWVALMSRIAAMGGMGESGKTPL